MQPIIYYILTTIAGGIITYLFVKTKFDKPQSDSTSDSRIDLIISNLNKIEGGLKQDFQIQATVIANIEKEIRAQVEQKINLQIEAIKTEFRDFNTHLRTKFEDLTQHQKDRYEEIEKRQNELIVSTDKHLT